MEWVPPLPKGTQAPGEGKPSLPSVRSSAQYPHPTSLLGVPHGCRPGPRGALSAETISQAPGLASSQGPSSLFLGLWEPRS